MKRLLSVILAAALVLAAAGCQKKYDPQQPEGRSSEPESSQAAPEPVEPQPIMPVPESSSTPAEEPDEDPDEDEEPDEDPEPDEDEEPEDDEDEEPAEDDADAEEGDGEDEDGEESDEDDEDEEDEDDGLDEYGFPAVPHGEELSWLNLRTVTVDELRPLLNKVLARAEYFCKFGTTGSFAEAGPDPRKEVSIQRPYRTLGDRTYYPYTTLSIHTLDELEEQLMTAFSYNVLTADMLYLFEIMTDDGNRLYYADGVLGLNKARGWDTSDMVIKEATDQQMTLHMTTSWQGEVFDADLSVRLWDGYLVLEPSYFVISEAQQASMHHTL